MGRVRAPKVDQHTGELLYFSYSKEAPHLRLGVVDARGTTAREIDVPTPGPRQPHDMAFTERFAILNDFPVYWDAELLARGVHRPRLHDGVPSRFALVPRAGGEPRWFEAEPTFVLHFVNAYDDGDEVILDGFHQENPIPSLDLHAMITRPHRWRFDLRTGTTREEPLFDEICEFPSIENRVAGRRHRRIHAMTAKPGWFLFDGMIHHFDLETGAIDRWRWPEGGASPARPS